MASEGATFGQLETRGTLSKTKRFRPGADQTKLAVQHRLIRLPKGSKPVTVPLTPFQEFCWRVMGPFVLSRYKENQDLEDDLIKAHIRMRPEEYLAVAWMTITMLAVASAVLALVFGILLFALSVSILTLVFLLFVIAGLPLLFGYIRYFGFPGGFLYRGKPASAAKKRARKIDARITSSMSFISAMASADVPVDVIFKELSRQPVYGEVAKEAEWITRDTELLGVDILTAIRRGAGRSPSGKFQDFLQGVVTTSTSGGQLKPYFLLKAEQYEKEDRLEMRKKMETLGMLAEAFVTVVVAFPLFLVVIMAIMALISRGQSDFVVTLLFAVVGLMIPVSQFGFIFVIWNMEQEI
ncbi:MAG TPA: type II secretion system F family protein [Thermoplasmata archaeon]|jgi:flagellar protein FlaJ|nr:type II secretion system F family protein [Thermoplasmata archaeon]